MSNVALIPEDLKLQAVELLKAAMMGERPLVIVEGFDDIRLYESFAKQAEVTCQIIASENILTEKEGCEGVISNIDVIELVAGNTDISKHVVGIIDRDARYFRNDMPASPAILTLDLYSIESHFVGEETIRRILSSVLNVSDELLHKTDTNQIFRDIVNRLMGVYEVSLEALKKSCVRGYSAEIGYADKVRSVFLNGAYAKIMAKQPALEQFASTLNIARDWQNLTLICKGKWLLDLFCDYLHDYISNLPQMCASGHLVQCQYCSGGNNKKCLYRWRENFQSAHLRGLARGYVDLPDFAYIKARLKSLG
ncbi:DUF4435 domain-containing protein [Pseudomonas glycinis]